MHTKFDPTTDITADHDLAWLADRNREMESKAARYDRIVAMVGSLEEGSDECVKIHRDDVGHYVVKVGYMRYSGNTLEDALDEASHHNQ